MIYSGTGHRSPKLGLSYTDASRNLLVKFVTIELAKVQDATEILSGMAEGFDQAWAEAALALGIPLTAAVAFEGMDAKWPQGARDRFNSILEQAKRVVYVCPPGYSPAKFIERDRWLVDNSGALVALYDESERKSGTGATVAYARKLNRPVYNWWSQWLYVRNERV